jgi:hypothetical protein
MGRLCSECLYLASNNWWCAKKGESIVKHTDADECPHFERSDRDGTG